MKLPFLKTSDEINVDKTKLCPFEKYNYQKYFPFLLKSYCHSHKSRLHMLHHKLFCWLFCKNYRYMIIKYNKSQKIK
jgi:hypothetical protein